MKVVRQGVRCVVHYQVPASADVYVHRSGRTARAAADGLAVTLVTPREAPRYAALMQALGQALPPDFPMDAALMPAVRRRVRLAVRLDEALRTRSKAAVELGWRQRTAEAAGIDLSDDEDGGEASGSAPGGERAIAALQRVRSLPLLPCLIILSHLLLSPSIAESIRSLLTHEFFSCRSSRTPWRSPCSLASAPNTSPAGPLLMALSPRAASLLRPETVPLPWWRWQRGWLSTARRPPWQTPTRCRCHSRGPYSMQRPCGWELLWLVAEMHILLTKLFPSKPDMRVCRNVRCVGMGVSSALPGGLPMDCKR